MKNEAAVAFAPVPDRVAVAEKEAAKYIGYSVHWLRLARRQGRGPRYLKIQNAVRYRLKDLDEWLDSFLVQPGKKRSA